MDTRDAGAAVVAPDGASASSEKDGSIVSLRLLATSDLHGHVRAFDYAAGRPKPGRGLEAAAELVAQLRREAANSLLFDAGDFLFGSELTDPVGGPDADAPAAQVQPHPMVAAMNALDFDAVALGNHDFDFGTAPLRAALRAARFPVLASNLYTMRDPASGATLSQQAALLTRKLTDRAGASHVVRIGVLAFLPRALLSQTAQRYPDVADLALCEVAQVAALRVARLRARGADLVVALCHDGLRDRTASEAGGPLWLARHGGVDAIVMGHEHGVFPRPQARRPCESPVAGVDADAGLLAGVPAVMPGSQGQHVGRIDLEIARDAAGSWRVVSRHVATLSTAGLGGRPHPPARGRVLQDLTATAHARACAIAARPIANLPQCASTYLARLGRCPLTMLVARVMARTVAERMPGHASAPVIGLAAPFRSGGLGGPENFVAIPEGPLSLGHLNDIFPFPDRICAVEVTGAELWDWVERTAAGFRRIEAHGGPQPLVEPAMPGSDFHLSPDLSITLDLSRPARFTPAGAAVPGQPGRVIDLVLRGRRVALDGRFVLALTEYRAGGGGAFPGCAPDRLRWTSEISVRAALERSAGACMSGALYEPGVKLHVPEGAVPLFTTGPGAIGDAAALRAARLEAVWPAGSDWLECRLTGDAPPLEFGSAGAYLSPREVGAGRHLANPVRSGRKQP